MIQNDFTQDAGYHHEDEVVADQPASSATEAAAGTKSLSPDAPAARAPVKATVVDPALAAGAAVVPAKVVQVRTSKASSITSANSSVYQDTELVFDFGRYVGSVDPITGLRHGQGTLTYHNGNVYEGEWKHGAPDGIGEKRYKNGDVYRGGWQQGERQGRGGYLFATGHYFEGMYKGDVPNGYGMLTTVTGDRYAGHWRDGKKDGKGRETLADGQTFIGHWKNGKKQGRGKLLLPGAAGALYGIWHQDHFFRELTEEEMGVDGPMDIVDEFGLPRGEDGENGVTARAGAAAAGNPFDLQSISQRLQQHLMSGVSAMESRLDALSDALEHITTADADADSDGAVNKPATAVEVTARRSSPAAAVARPMMASRVPVTATVAGTVESLSDGVEAARQSPPAGMSDESDGSAHILSTVDTEEAEAPHEK